MAKVLDIRNSDGQLILLGGALVLPTSSNSVTSPMNGSIRWNTTEQTVEYYYDGTWSPISSTPSLSLGELTDVDLSTPENAQVLAYDSEIGFWTNVYPPYDMYGTYIGVPSGAVLWQVVFAREVVFPVNLVGSVAICLSASTVNVMMAIFKNGSSIGSINFAASSLVATFTFASQVTFNSGDILQVYGPSPTNSNFLSPSWSFVGSRTS